MRPTICSIILSVVVSITGVALVLVSMYSSENPVFIIGITLSCGGWLSLVITVTCCIKKDNFRTPKSQSIMPSVVASTLPLYKQIAEPDPILCRAMVHVNYRACDDTCNKMSENTAQSRMKLLVPVKRCDYMLVTSSEARLSR